MALLFAPIVNEQLPVPEQSPLHPEKVYPEFGITVSIIEVPLFKVAEQDEPHEIAEGLLVTVPFAEVTERVYLVFVVPPLVVKLVVTLLFALTVNTQLPVPEQAPPQPAKVEPLAGVAVSVTDVPEFTVAEQVDPQFIPPPETVPEPVPEFETDRV